MELYKKIPKDAVIVVVDDFSPDTDCQTGPAWWQKSVLGEDRLKYYRNPQNTGFGASMNNGVLIAVKHGCEGLILLSNDVRVMSDIVTEQATLLSLDNRILIGAEILRGHTGWNDLPGCGPVPYANGWFLSTHKKTWRELGGFDLRYGRFDYEDVDLSTTAIMKKIPLIGSTSDLKHIGGQSVSAATNDRTSQTLKNQKLWIEKWTPHAEELKRKIYGSL
jgi:GT2 family glycosyltransferase